MDDEREPAPERTLRLRYLPSFVSNTGQALPLYVVKAWLLTLIPSLILATLVTQVALGTPGPEFGAPSPYTLFLIVVFAPVGETLIMVPPLLLLNRLLGPQLAIPVNALLWGIAHSLAAPAWGLIVWWPFLIFSAVALVWRSEGKLLKGMLLVMLIHAMQNMVGALPLLLA